MFCIAATFHASSLKSLKLTGKIIAGPAGTCTYTFLSAKHDLWTKGHNRRARSRSRGGEAPAEDRVVPKLSGTYEWPFEFSFPGDVFLGDDESPGDNNHPAFGPFKLPATFLAGGCPIAIQYSFEIRIARGKLKPDAK